MTKVPDILKRKCIYETHHRAHEYLLIFENSPKSSNMEIDASFSGVRASAWQGPVLSRLSQIMPAHPRPALQTLYCMTLCDVTATSNQTLRSAFCVVY